MIIFLKGDLKLDGAVTPNDTILKNVKNSHGGVLLLVKLQAGGVLLLVKLQASASLLHASFSRFLNCTNGPKSHKAPMMCRTYILFK